MELKLQNGDYLSDGAGGLRQVEGAEALLQRVGLKLSARRGAFPFMEQFGSRLWRLGQLPAKERESAAKQYVVEALEDEANLTVEEVTLEEQADGVMGVSVNLVWKGEALSMTLEVR